MEISCMTLEPEKLFPGDTSTVHQRDTTQNFMYNASAILKS